jgi:hypothetical protein
VKRLAALSTVLLCCAAGPALAQSAPPVGYWSTPDGGERLLVSNGQCSFAATGAATWGGSCGWDATYSGGILSIEYSTVQGPALVRFNVTWTGQNSISVNGDPFYRIGQ